MGSSCFGELAQPFLKIMRFFKTGIFLLILFALAPQIASAQDSKVAVGPEDAHPLYAPETQLQRAWVDSIYNSMSLEEKVGQLFMVDVFSNQSAAETRKISKYIEEHHLGGIIFSKGGPQQQVKLTNEFQGLSEVPLLIAMDAEWGAAMRLDSTFAFPWNMTLGAIKDSTLIEETGEAIAGDLRRLGVHMNFAPVVDINTNPDNPIIGNRSFGESRENVSEKALAFMRGMEKGKVLSVAKHFPGHGDTNTDSHKALPVLDFSKKRLKETELYPFEELIANGLPGVMVGHLEVPAFEKRKGFPSSLSKPIVTDLLKDKMEFQGLVVTDALAMEGARIPEIGGNSLAAFLAGNDLLLMPKDLPEAVQSLINAYKTDIFSEERLQHSVKKILFAKYKVGLHDYEPVDPDSLYEDLNSIRHKVLNQKLIEEAITVIRNEHEILPIKDLKNTKIAYVNFGEEDGSAFLKQLRKYSAVDEVKAEHLGELLEELKSYHLVIVGFHKSGANPWTSYKFSEKELTWLQEISRTSEVILNIFTSPYALLDLKSSVNIESIVVNYQNTPVTQKKAAQLIFGALCAKGQLPVSAGPGFPEGTGFSTEDLQRLTYGLPESVGMNSYKLKKIDSLINATIEGKMAPGVQVVVARKGKVIYNNSAGYHTYKKEIPVKDSDVYDLASLTKILATLPLVMELVDKDELGLNTKLAQLLPGFEDSNKEQVNLRQMLSHYARFQPWIPFYRYTFDEERGGPSPEYYRHEGIRGFDTKVAEGLFIRNDIRDSIINIINESVLNEELEYRYSDLPYYLLKKYLEESYGTSLGYLTQSHFYRSLGANNTSYLPLNKFSKERIVPTARDKGWRDQLLHGYVHDEGAALLGGIGGHAGLFSNANDVAKIMQMYLNGGVYGGVRYFKEETFNKFNTCYYCEDGVRRGVGFDKPQLSKAGPTCGCVSMNSFGHSGFTGTFTWADPDEEIVYVFLSNRIHPSVENRKLNQHDIRKKIQAAIYEAIDY